MLTEGEYCFTAVSGLWRIWAQIFPEEEEKGLTWKYGGPNGMRAFITGGGINNLNIAQANITISGTIYCFDQEKCKNDEVRIV